MQVQFALSCCCDGDEEAAPAPASGSSAPPMTGGFPNSSSLSSRPLHPSALRADDAASNGNTSTVRLLERDEALSLMAAAAEAQATTGQHTLPLHHPACRCILVKCQPGGKTALHGDSSDSNDALRYELAIRELILSAEPAPSHVQSVCDSPTAASADTLSPALLPLLDGRRSLVLGVAYGAQTLAEYIAALSTVDGVQPQQQQQQQTTSDTSSPHVSSKSAPRASSRAIVVSAQVRNGSTAQPAVTAAAAARSSVPRILDSLECMLRLTKELHRVHNAQLVHRALHPASILYSPRSGAVAFLDLGSATAVTSEGASGTGGGSLHSEQANLSVGVGGASSWLYAAGELSGKSHRSIDGRADLYSLGAIMFHMLAGRPPFDSPDPLSLVHMHLARSAPSLLSAHLSRESQPLLHALMSVVAAIVAKLLEKQLAKRYQSTAGLAADLKKIIQIVRPIVNVAASASASSASSSASAVVPTVTSDPSLLAACLLSLGSFSIGTLDLSPVFRISPSLYGRDSELAALYAAHAAMMLAADPEGKGARGNKLWASPGTKRVTMASSASGGSGGAGGSLLSDGLSNGLSLPSASSSSLAKPAPQLLLLSGASGLGKVGQNTGTAHARTKQARWGSILPFCMSSALTFALPPGPSHRCCFSFLFVCCVCQTSLVDELQKSIARHRTLFARSKFELLKRDSSCLLSAICSCVTQLFIQDALTWRVRLTRALGSHAAVLVDAMPPLVRLIGEQPEPTSVYSMQEAANRFQEAFTILLTTIATPANPIVMFIDDLQWADTGSLALLKLMLAQDAAHLLLIGTLDRGCVAAHTVLARVFAI